MKMNIDKEWLLHMAGLEASAIISVGGLVHEIESDVSSVSCYEPLSAEESQLRRAVKSLREHRLSVLRKKRRQKRGKK